MIDTDLVNLRKPIFNLKGFSEVELKEIAAKLTIMHEEVYQWDSSESIAPVLDDIVAIHVRDAGLTGGKITPRVFIRSFISVLDTIQQNQSFFNNHGKILELFEKQEATHETLEEIDEFDDDW